MIRQKQLSLQPRSRGFHLISKEVLNELGQLPKSGMLNLFCQHTSAGLTLNENCDSSVRVDFESSFNNLVPENQTYYTHTAEGPDDMPAHIKSTLVGASLNIPIVDNQLALGTWQGIYLCEFRNSARSRRVVATVYE